MAALMSLATGTRLGPYQVGAQIGAGGMGEVYRATDTNLGRDVAIKVLPAGVAQDAERLEVLAPGVTQPPLQVIINWPALLQR